METEILKKYLAVMSLSYGTWDLWSSLQHADFLVATFELLAVTFELLVGICGVLIPHPGIKPRSPALGAWHLSHWTTKGVLETEIRVSCNF